MLCLLCVSARVDARIRWSYVYCWTLSRRAGVHGALPAVRIRVRGEWACPPERCITEIFGFCTFPLSSNPLCFSPAFALFRRRFVVGDLSVGGGGKLGTCRVVLVEERRLSLTFGKRYMSLLVSSSHRTHFSVKALLVEHALLTTWDSSLHASRISASYRVFMHVHPLTLTSASNRSQAALGFHFPTPSSG